MQTLESTISRISEAANQIKSVAYEIDNIFEKSIPNTLNDANASLRHEDHLIALSKPRVWDGLKVSLNDRMEELAHQGTQLYVGIVPDVHEVYTNWTKPKQVRAERRFRLATSYPLVAWTTWRVEEIRTGEVGTILPMDYIQLLGVACGLRALAEENENQDDSDPYWERIRDAVIIEPRPGYTVPIHLHREDGYGNWVWGYRFDEYFKPSTLIESLVGEKVIFYPISTKEAAVSYRHPRYSNIELPFAFEVRALNGDGGPTTMVIGKIEAQEFNPFTKTNSKQVVDFFRRHIL